MIRSLRLSNWRNYDDLSISFGPGATFVVASNGVGKTSLVEAVRFAIFGLVSSAASPVRLGKDEANVTVVVELPDGRQLTIDRKLTAKRTRIPPTVSVSLAGRRCTDEEFEGVIRDAYGADLTFLSRLVMPAVSRDLDRPSALGLEDHLGRYFGVDGLQNALPALDAQKKDIAKQIRAIKNAHSATAQQLSALEAEVARADSLTHAATAEHATAGQLLERARAYHHAVAAQTAWAERQAQSETQRQALLTEIAGEVGEQVDRDVIDGSLNRWIADLTAQIEDARVRRAVLEARTELITASETSLDGAHGDCPVCRRPLDDATVIEAHASNSADMIELEREAATVREQEVATADARARLQKLLQRWTGLPDAGPEPALPRADADVVGLGVEAATRNVADALEHMVSARAAKVESERRLDEARDADDAMRELERLFRAEAELSVTYETITATLAELLEHTVRPMASQVGQRWATLFPDRGRLTTRSDGTMTRQVNGQELPYDAFSTGEGMGATIVLRLLVAQMATTVDFCWFDEPLEHLDPDVRRRVANILSRASSGDSPLKQIVVTTYEEPLARALASSRPGDVHLVDVRQPMTTATPPAF